MKFLRRIFKKEKADEIKEKIESLKKALVKIDKKYDVSERIEGAKNSVVEMSGKVENKVENYIDKKISIFAFKKTEIRVGEILKIEKIKKSKNLLRLEVDLGEKKHRQIISGIANYYKNPEKELKGKQALFVANLDPVDIFGHKSDGMILGVKNKKAFSILTPEIEVKNGVLAG